MQPGKASRPGETVQRRRTPAARPRLPGLLGLGLGLAIGLAPGVAPAAEVPAGVSAPLQEQSEDGSRRLPNIVLIVVDTLRADRLSAYGNPAPTSPYIDRLLAAGTRFTTARTVEPLTAPAAASLLTSLYPHEHGTSRNGIPIRDGLRSLTGMLTRLGYVTVAFVSNWTLADEQSGLAAHFDVYQEVFTKKRWLFWFGESDAEDVRLAARTWLDEVGTYPGQPLFLWAHFVEPHAPYKLQEAYAERLGLDPDGPASALQRYDTEIAAVDDAIGRLMRDLERHLDPADTLYVFTSDHGEGLGEHGYKGHGRRLYEEELRIPLGFIWPGRIRAGEVLEAPASLIDLAPTLLGLLGAPSPPEWRGCDWSRVLLQGGDGPQDRPTFFQAHKGVALRASGDEAVASNKRRRGLLQLGFAQGGRKGVLDVQKGKLRLYDLAGATHETAPAYAGSEDRATATDPVPELLRDWRKEVEAGLAERDRAPPPQLTEEALEKLRSLGYTN